MTSITKNNPPFSLEQIGVGTVRFSSKGHFETHKDQMVDPYAETRIPKDIQIEGYQYAPQKTGKFPGIIFLHDRWGLTSQTQEMARQLAREGYVVLVPNFYNRQGGMITANAEVADALMNRLDEQLVLQDINICCEYLNANLSDEASLEQTERNAHAVVGFGMGGRLALLFATRRKHLKGAVAFGGAIDNGPELVQHFHCPVLSHIPQLNDSSDSQKINQFQEAASQAVQPVEIQTYPNASPEFWNDTRPDSYQPDMTDRAWTITVNFLKNIFPNP